MWTLQYFLIDFSFDYFIRYWFSIAISSSRGHLVAQVSTCSILFLIPYWHGIRSNKMIYTLWTTWQCVSMIPSLSKPELIINNFDRELATYIELLSDMSSRARGVVVSTSVGWSWRPRFDSWRAQIFFYHFEKLKINVDWKLYLSLK